MGGRLSGRLDRWPRLKRPLYVATHLGDLYDRLLPQPAYHPGAITEAEVRARRDFIRAGFTCIAHNGIAGDYAEFGCHGGMTFTMAFAASKLVGRDTHLWGFDSFEGLPEPRHELDRHPEWTCGAMAMGVDDFHRRCRERGMGASDYTVVAGFYERSLTDPAQPSPQRVAFAYVDCDYYTSTSEVLRYVEPRLQHGSILALDDYYCVSPQHTSGERKAVAETFAQHARWRLVPYLPFGWHGMSFLLESRGEVAEVGADW